MFGNLHTLLHVRPTDPARTAIAEYARHFQTVLGLLPGLTVRDFLAPELSERIDSATDRESVRSFVRGAASALPGRGEGTAVLVETGNSLHREFWAGRFLQQFLPGARFLCTVHDPPFLSSNPYRYLRTEQGGRTPFPLADRVLTRLSEEVVLRRKASAERRFVRGCGDVLVLSGGGRRVLSASPLFRGARIGVLPHVFDTATVPFSGPAAEAGAGLTTVLFCFLGPGKGIECLIDAFEILQERLRRVPGSPAHRLLIFGGVPASARAADWLEGLARRIEASPARTRIDFRPGFAEDAERDRLLAGADIVTLPFPTVATAFSSASLLRGMALGRAVVAARANTAGEFITDGANGLLHPESDPAALADCLLRLTLDAGLRVRLGVAARRSVEEGHSPAAVAARLAAVLRGEAEA